MTFALESELCSALFGAWQSHLGGEALVSVLREVRVGQVIPDQIVVRFSPRVRIENYLPVLTFFESAVLAAFADDAGRRVTTIASQLFAREERVHEVLVRMERRGLLQRVQRGVYRLSHSIMPRHMEVIAVEAKLTRWRDAADQALEYRRFANRVYVALPTATIEDHFLPCVDYCEMHGLGLLAVGPEGTELMLDASSESPWTAERLWLISRLTRHEASAVPSGSRETDRTPLSTSVGG